MKRKSLSKLRKSLGLQRPNLHGARAFSSSKCANPPSSHHHHHQTLAPNVTSSSSRGHFDLPRPNVGLRWARSHRPRCLLLPPKATSIICQLPRCGSWHPLCGLQAPMKAQARLVPPKTSIKQGPAKTNECALQGSQVKCIMPSKITFNTRAT
jgi:hypothetical protein